MQTPLNEGGFSGIGRINQQLYYTLGFTPENLRRDRDAHVTVLWDNIIPGIVICYNFYAKIMFFYTTLMNWIKVMKPCSVSYVMGILSHCYLMISVAFLIISRMILANLDYRP